MNEFNNSWIQPSNKFLQSSQSNLIQHYSRFWVISQISTMYIVLRTMFIVLGIWVTSLSRINVMWAKIHCATITCCCFLLHLQSLFVQVFNAFVVCRVFHWLTLQLFCLSTWRLVTKATTTTLQKILRLVLVQECVMVSVPRRVSVRKVLSKKNPKSKLVTGDFLKPLLATSDCHFIFGVTS